MTTRINIHPLNPQARLIQDVVTVFSEGGVIVYPTDSGYAMGCQMGDKAAVERIRHIRQLSKHHHFTLLCHDLSQIASYAYVSNTNFRLLKAYTPGAYTFILPASKEVPRRLVHPKRKTIGLRVPDHAVTLAILAALGTPLMSVTLILAEDEEGEEMLLNETDEILEQLSGRIDAIVDSGYCEFAPTSVIDLTSGTPEILRVGKGDVSQFY